MEEGFCAYCGQWLPLKDDLLPGHDWPKPTRRVCTGAKTPPLNRRAMLTIQSVKAWREDAAFDERTARYIDWLIERAERSLCTLVEIARHSEDEDGERPTPEAKLARKTLYKLHHVED